MKLKKNENWKGGGEYGIASLVFHKTVCGRYYVCLATGEVKDAQAYEKAIASNGHWLCWEGELEDGTKIVVDSRVKA